MVAHVGDGEAIPRSQPQRGNRELVAHDFGATPACRISELLCAAALLAAAAAGVDVAESIHNMYVETLLSTLRVPYATSCI